MAFTKIVSADLVNKGVIGLPDSPNLGTMEMQEKFDELALDVIVPKHNALIDELTDTTAATNIGASAPAGIVGSTVQDILNAIGSGQSALNGPEGASKVGIHPPAGMVLEDEHVQGYLDALKDFTDALKSLSGANQIGARVPDGIISSADTVQEVIEEVYRACKSVATGDMTKAVYDTEDRGYVDRAVMADNISDLAASDIQAKIDNGLETTSKSVVGAINELKRSSDLFDSTAMFYIDANGHYCVDTLQAEEIIEFRVVNNHLTITVDV